MTQPTVTLHTTSNPSEIQRVVGILSHLPSVEEFRGIPYGHVSSRWQHSTLRHALPINVFDATKYGPRSPQPASGNNTLIFQSHLDFPDVPEDEFECLNLLVVRPCPSAVTKALGGGWEKKGLPVYFYIHGGAYAFGAGNDPMWDPSRLVAASLEAGKPFVAVNINYRLNIFGFGVSSSILSAQDSSDVSSSKAVNFGLHDQYIALQWVSKNIANFGGDPERITIGGQSAGSCSVHALVLDAKASGRRPLFARAIMQSGAVGTMRPISMAEADQKWKVLQDTIGKDQDVATLRTEELVNIAEQLGWSSYRLVEDGVSVKAAEAHGSWSIDLGGRQETSKGKTDEQEKPLVVLIGDTDDEGMLWGTQVSQTGSFEELNSLLSSIIQPQVLKQLKDEYDLAPNIPLSDLRANLVQLLTDIVFGQPVYQAYSELTSNATVGTKNAFPTKTQLFRIGYGNPWPGPTFRLAHHCVDIIYIYDAFHDTLRATDKEEELGANRVTNAELVKAMQELWINFIAGGGKEGRGVNEDEILVFEKDRVGRTKNINEDKVFLARKKRLDFVGLHIGELRNILNVIRGG